MSELFPPFQPDKDEPRKRRFKPIPFRLLAPNLITLLGLALGLTGMRLAIEGKLELGVVCVLIAAALDGVDGRLARFLKGTSRFGAQLDSLADFVNFGVVPAVVLYHFVLKDLKNFGWIVCIIFAIAMCLRLARFNVMIDDPNRPDWQKNFFTGMPAPAGAVTAMLPLYLYFLGVPIVPYGAVPVGLYLLFCAFLTISTVPMYAGKTLGAKVPRNWVAPIFISVILAIALVVAYPFEMLSLIVIGYFAAIPLSMQKFRALELADRMAAAKASAMAAETPQTPAPAS
ncbi:MAG: phosphatidylcholine/phosphatidylserine synthase [Hyphomicrobiales bacterium]|nr:phosphatidylcholine/phosphatidylserine synthase [Hyphomicrobiales bacterium]